MARPSIAPDGVLDPQAAPGVYLNVPGIPMAVQQGSGTHFLRLFGAFKSGPRRGYNVVQEQSPAGRGPTATVRRLKSHVWHHKTSFRDPTWA